MRPVLGIGHVTGVYPQIHDDSGIRDCGTNDAVFHGLSCIAINLPNLLVVIRGIYVMASKGLMKSTTITVILYLVCSVAYAEQCNVTPVVRADAWRLALTSLLKPQKAAEFESYWVYDVSEVTQGQVDGILVTKDISDGGSVFLESSLTPAQLDELRTDGSRSGSVPELNFYAVSTTKLERQTPYEFVVSDLGKPDVAENAGSTFVDCDALKRIESDFIEDGGELKHIEGSSSGTDDRKEIPADPLEAHFGRDSNGREESVLEETGEDVDGRPLLRKPRSG